MQVEVSFQDTNRQIPMKSGAKPQKQIIPLDGTTEDWSGLIDYIVKEAVKGLGVSPKYLALKPSANIMETQ